MIHFSFVCINFTSISTFTKIFYCFKLLKSYLYLLALYIKSFHLLFYSHFLISFILFLVSLVLISFATSCFLPWSSIVFTCFSNALLSGKYINLAYFIILLWPDGNISSPVRNSNLSIFPDNNADIFAAFVNIGIWW